MEKLSTECLEGLRDRINSILKERESEENELDGLLLGDSPSWEERRKLYRDRFEAYIEKFNEQFPLFLKAKREWLTANTVNEHGGYINKVQNFKSLDWYNLLQDMKSNGIFNLYTLV